MSVALMTAAWLTALRPASKLVLLAVADIASDDGLCQPTIAMIAKKTSMSPRYVRINLAYLEEKKYLLRESQLGFENLFRLHPFNGWEDFVSGKASPNIPLQSQKRKHGRPTKAEIEARNTAMNFKTSPDSIAASSSSALSTPRPVAIPYVEQPKFTLRSPLANSKPANEPLADPYLLPLRNGEGTVDLAACRQQYQAAFPTLDIDKELKLMVVWANANPRKRKTRSGIDRFISRWLASTLHTQANRRIWDTHRDGMHRRSFSNVNDKPGLKQNADGSYQF